MGHRLRVVLAKPPEQSSLNFGTFSLAVLASAIEDIANVKIIDLTKLESKQATEVVLSQKPDLLGVTVMSVNSVEPVCGLIQLLRNSGFEGKIVAGGHGASVLPLSILESGADAVVYGEGEQTFREVVLRGISDCTPGIYIMKDGKLSKTTPRSLIDLETLILPAKKWISSSQDGFCLLETSRGCPHNCKFCETSLFFGNTWRSRSPDKVIEDIGVLVKRGTLIIQITDDNFTANPSRVLEICRRLENRNLPLFFVFSARSDDLLTYPELIPSLAKANFLRAAIGVETPNAKLSQQINKNISLQQHKRAFGSLRKAGVYTVASFIVGLPEETEETRADYVKVACELADSATFVPFRPFPGTELGDKAIYFKPQPWSVDYAARLTREFRRNPGNIERLLEAVKEPSVRGLLAKRSLQKRITENILDEPVISKIKQIIG